MRATANSIARWIRGVLPRKRSGRKLPDFFCLGAQKTGTTWLYYELARHPQVRMPAIKELAWFSDHATSWEEYLGHFTETNGFITGDITPRYLIAPMAAREIRRRVPDAKLFAILREPGERAFSQYRMLRGKQRIGLDEPFLDVFERDVMSIRTRGHYSEQLARYQECYRLGHDLEVFFFDDLKRDAVSFIHRIDRFLGIDEYASPAVHKHWTPSYGNDPSKMTPAERQVLNDYYSAHNEKLFERLGRGPVWESEPARG